MKLIYVPILTIALLISGCKSGDSATTATEAPKSPSGGASTTDAPMSTGTTGSDASTVASKDATAGTPSSTPAAKTNSPNGSGESNYPIVGTWIGEDNSKDQITVEYKADGTMSANVFIASDKTSVQLAGTYKVDGKQLKVKPTLYKVIPPPNADEKAKETAATMNASSEKGMKDAPVQTDSIEWKDKDTFIDIDSSKKPVTFKRKH